MRVPIMRSSYDGGEIQDAIRREFSAKKPRGVRPTIQIGILDKSHPGVIHGPEGADWGRIWGPP